MACKYYYNGKEFTEEELKAAMLAGEFDREAKNMGIDIPSMKVVSGPSIRSKEQVTAYHGSPHAFDRFTTEYMGAGEGRQAFGWGLYFTDLKDIAKIYADNLAYETFAVDGNLISANVNKALKWTAATSFEDENGNYVEDVSESNIKDIAKQAIKDELELAAYSTSREVDKDYIKELEQIVNGKNIKSIKEKNLYEVSLHKGKTPDQYTWLEWDKKPNKEQVNKLFSKLTQEQLDKGFYYGLAPDATNGTLYRSLSNALGSPKQASLFLLENGIDGVKYPAEMRARGATSETARGFNYVVFDENAVTVEARSKEQTSGRVTPNLSNIQGSVNSVVASLPNVNIQIDGARFNQLLSDPESVRITDASGNVVAIYNNGEVVVDPVATVNDDASITSLGYVWMELAKGKDTAVYTQMIEAVKGTQYETDARQADADMQAQGFPAMTEEQILQRAAAEAIKDRANAFNDRTFGQKIKDAIKKFGEFLNKLFGMSKDYNFLDMTIGDYADIAARSLMGNRQISDVSNIDLDDIIENGPFVSVPGGMLGSKPGWLDRGIKKAGDKRLFKTIVPRNFTNTRSLLKYWFDNKYQNKINSMNTQKSNAIESKMRQIRDNVKNFRKQFKKATKGMTDAQKQNLINDISDFLGGKDASGLFAGNSNRPLKTLVDIADLKAAYPQAIGLLNSVELMRASIDALSKEIQSTIDPTSELYGTIDQNMGIYLNRAYAAFKDGGWNKSMFPKGKDTPFDLTSGRNPEMQAIYKAAVDYIRQNYPDVTPEEADAKLKEYARLSNNQSDPLQEIKGKMGTAIDDLLKQRQDLPPELRAFFGEYTDPLQKFYFTMENMVNYAENKKFLIKLKEMGMGSMFFEKPTGIFNEEIAGSDTYSPMAGLYTTPEIVDLLKNTDNSLKIEFLRDMASYWKAFKTIGSIKTTIRNFDANIFFQFANGRFIPVWNMVSVRKEKGYGGLILSIKELFRMPSDMNNELVALGVINSGLSKELQQSVSGFVNSIYEDGIQTIKDADTIIDKSKYIIQKTGKIAARVYEFMDNVWRITSYLSELDDCKRMFPSMSNDELKKLAAERFRETNVTYDKTPNIVKRVAASPVIGSFPSFASESIRTSKSIPRLAIQDIKDGIANNNTSQLFVGVKRLTGFAATGSFILGLAGIAGTSIVKSMLGIEPPDEDEERVLYEGAPEYAKNNSRIITGSKPGEITAFELDWLNPWNIYTKSYHAYTRTDKYDPERYPTIEGAWALLEPFLGEEGIYAIARQWDSNDDGRGGQIYDPQDPTEKQMYDAIPWAMKNVVPGIATFGYDLYNSIGVNPQYDRGKKTTSELLRSEFMGFKEQKINTLNSFSSKLQTEYTPKITTQLNEINNIEYNYEQAVIKAKGMGDDNIRKDFLKENLPKINQANIHLWRMQDDVRKYATSLYATGVPGVDISKKIDNSMKYKSLGGVAAFDISSENLIQGEYHIRTLSPEMLEMLGYKNQQEYVDFLNSTLK